MKSRRTALAMLGLVPAGSALAIENFYTEPEADDGRVRSGHTAYQKERFIKALENLAAAVRDDQIEIENLNVHAALSSDSIVDRHHLNITFLMRPDPPIA